VTKFRLVFAELRRLYIFFCSGPKHPQKITNWGPAAFTEAELSLREKDWQVKKNRPATPQ